MSEIYFDHHSFSSPCSSSVEKMLITLQNRWGAIDSSHKRGKQSYEDKLQAEEMLQEYLGFSQKDRFFLTSSSVEGFNKLIHSLYFEKVRKEGKNHFLIASGEKPILYEILSRYDSLACHFDIVPFTPSGEIDLEYLEEKILPKTACFSLCWAHPLTGVIQPIEKIQKICREKGVFLHVEGSYSLGKIPFRFSDFEIDCFTFRGEAIHAPVSGGMIFGERALTSLASCLPIELQNVPLLSSLAIGCQQSFLHLTQTVMETARIRQIFEQRLQKELKSEIYLSQNRLPNVSCLSIPNVHQELALYHLNRKGIYASAGGGENPLLAHILKECKVENPHSSLSFSFSRYTTEEEVEKGVERIIEEGKELQKLSKEL